MAGGPAHRETARGRLSGEAVISVHKPTACHSGYSEFLVVDSLIYPVILRTDFPYKHYLYLDLTSSPVTVQHNKLQIESVQPI